MISFHHSSPYYSTHHHLVYPDDAFSSPFAYQPLYSSYLSRSTDPEMRYRRSLAEYLAAEKEYNTILRSREEAILRARADALYRQEQMRLHLAQVVRARKEQKARQLEEALAKAQAEDLAAQTTVPIFPVVFSVPHHHRTTVPATRLSSHSSPVNDPTGLPDPMPQSDIKVCGVCLLFV
ncbi:hypothetical protein B0F90DRAFT_659051 [Multifurca ochricompacta]|uniref:Uncharacterized protein n=1 Tax=Multifurca ochricompacta TaxID=376703 RepID=A0AAD4QLE5_9AGAM|nr:hypothetical protein B0F90DRAFT_659051 [Multifurca ochricompacta]